MKEVTVRERGWDYFSCLPGVQDYVQCKVCGERIEPQRDREVYGTYVNAIAGGAKRIMDVFACHNSDKAWHRQVLEMKKYHDDLPSAELRRIITGEINQILETRQNTIDI